MAGIQISGLLSNSAFDWKSVVDQLIKADSVPVTNLQNEQATNSSQVAALGQLQTNLTDLQTSLQNIRSGNLFSARVVSSDTPNTTWKSTSSNGAALGNYTFNVTQLATQAQVQGAGNVSAGISATNDVSAVTIASMNTATTITAGTFTVNGVQVSVATSGSLKTVFDAINAATGGDVTATYSSATDKITLTSASNTPIVLGAANDSSNFISAMKLFNNGAGSVTSSATLGIIKKSATLATAGLATALSGQDVSGNGSFTVNGVSISYNVNTDTVAGLLAQISSSSAGVTATYDSANNRFSLVNNSTGDFGLGLKDTTGNLLAAMGLTTAAGGAFQRGTNALYTVNNGPVLISTTNTLDSSTHGISGLGVTVNSKTVQTISVESDTGSMQNAIQDFVDKFNAVQDFVNTNTQIAITGSNVAKSVLTGNREVEGWASSLQSLAFASIPGVSKTVTKLDDLGIDFDGAALSGKLVIKNSTKLANALSQNPQDVQSYFLAPTTGFVAKMYGFLTTALQGDITQQNTLSAANKSLDDQIATLQTRLDNERTNLTNSFISMLDAQSKAQSQNTTLTNAFFSKNNNGG
jgi:flagellar hook-associated protein 2